MSLIQISLILFTVFLLSLGQILFKLASHDINVSYSKFIPSLMSPRLAIAFLVYSFATILWLIVLKDLPLRIAYPFAALAFVIVPTMAHFLLGADLSWNTYIGAGIISLGVIVSTYK